MKSLGIALLFLLCVGTAFGQQNEPDMTFFSGSGEQLQLKCKSALAEKRTTISELEDADYCIGYVQGLAESVQMDVVIPASVSNRQLIAIVVKYLDDNPVELNQPAWIEVGRAFHQAFPSIAEWKRKHTK
jgi:hypothetical protein